MKALKKLQEISKTLAPSKIEAVEKEAEFLVTQGLNVNLLDLYKNNPELDDKQNLIIDKIVKRRSKREPLQYILGYDDFLGLRLMIGYGVLIPRPETELMAEHAINIVKSQKSKVKSKKTEEKAEITNDGRQVTVLDLCTGSGCLALALAKELPHARVCGSDISETAISYAVMNARINGVENVSFLNGHLFDPLGSGELYDVIISNPPYIRTDEIETLQPEVRDWEPLNALDGGPDGLVFYREIIPAARKFLKDSGMLMLELGAGCARDVAQMMKDAGYRDVEIRKDYSGIKRIIQAQWTR